MLEFDLLTRARVSISFALRDAKPTSTITLQSVSSCWLIAPQTTPDRQWPTGDRPHLDDQTRKQTRGRLQTFKFDHAK